MIQELNICAKSDSGKQRAENQDHYLIGKTIGQSYLWCLMLDAKVPEFASEGLICAVADGIGGNRGGAEASKLALHTIASNPVPDRDNEGMWLSRLILQAHNLVVHDSEKDPGLEKMGTTLAGVYISPDICIAFHAGDSRLYRFRDGFLNQITTDHTLAFGGDLIRGNQKSAISHAITNSLGGGRSSRCIPTIQTGVSFRAGDLLMLCSDGLTDAVDIDTMESTLRSDSDLPDRLETLIAQANEAGGPDNITVMLIESR